MVWRAPPKSTTTRIDDASPSAVAAGLRGESNWVCGGMDPWTPAEGASAFLSRRLDFNVSATVSKTALITVHCAVSYPSMSLEVSGKRSKILGSVLGPDRVRGGGQM